MNAAEPILGTKEWLASLRQGLRSASPPAIVAFSIRTARRVAALLPFEPARTLDTIARYARGEEPAKELEEDLLDAMSYASGHACDAVSEAAIAAVMATAAAEPRISAADAAWRVACAVVDAAEACDGDSLVRRIQRAVWSDFQTLLRLAPHGNATIDPGEQGPFGTLWPEGEPDALHGCNRSATPQALPREERIESKVAALRELETRHPLPNTREVLDDYRWIDAKLDSPELDPFRGRYVAVLNHDVVATGANMLDLRLEAARNRLAHPARFAIRYLNHRPS